MLGPPLVRFDSVSKRFRIRHERPRSFQDLLVRGFRRGESSEEFWALRDVSFLAEPGVSLGIVGANGSGKSTLLKLVTRILAPTLGQITVRGRISALLELGAGFHPELSGRDNVFLNASILGMRRADVAARFDAIVRFADLERFIDIPVKHYSSGMYARLGFAVAISADPDVLLVDEVLSVGDEAFHARCLEAIHRLHVQGKTMLLVSHDVAAISSVCTRAIWLDEGRIRLEGEPRAVVAEYLAATREQAASSDVVGPGHETVGLPLAARRWGSGEAEILGVAILAMDERPNGEVCAGGPLTIRIRYRAREPIEGPVFGIGISTVQGVLVAGPNSRTRLRIPRIDGEGEVGFVVPALPLVAGEYRVSASIYDASCTHAYDYHDGWYPLTVASPGGFEQHGLVQLSGRWSHRDGQGVGGWGMGASGWGHGLNPAGDGTSVEG